jgi:hypothetical protein
MMVERLLVYEKKNKALPQRVFVFRDGVSEVGFLRRNGYCYVIKFSFFRVNSIRF